MHAKTARGIFLVLLPALASCGRFVSLFDSQTSVSGPLSRDDNARLRYESNVAKCEEQFFKQNSIVSGRTYESCEQIQADYQKYRSYESCVRTAAEAFPRDVLAKASGASSDGASARSNSSVANILTNARHQGVDEGDFVKFSDQQIFVGSDNKINVIDRKSKKHLGAIELGQGLQYNSAAQLLVRENNLIVIQDKRLRVYKLKDLELPVLHQERSLEQSPIEIRLLDDRLVLVSDGTLKYKPAQIESPEGNLDLSGVRCASIHRSDRFSWSFTQVESFPVSDIHQSSVVTFLGRHRLYMTDKNIYLYEDNWGGKSETLVRKVSLANPSALVLAGTARVKGHIKDVWALSELPSGELAVASSTGNLLDHTALNHFEIFSESNQTLAKISETPDYGANEDIRSVRFVGNIAYVVTFKKTDPLFAIDVSEPKNPKMLGQLKIPGFSTYMHPLNKDRLIGLGFDAFDMADFAYFQGLQLSLFDTSNPQNLLRKDVRILGLRGSSSAATADHKAFFMDPIERIVAFPVTLNLSCLDESACQNSTAAIPPQFASRKNYSGAAFYKIDGDSLGEAQFISHSDLMPDACASQVPSWTWWESNAITNDIARIFKIDGELLSVSKIGLKSLRWSGTLETLQATRWESNCTFRPMSIGL